MNSYLVLAQISETNLSLFSRYVFITFCSSMSWVIILHPKFNPLQTDRLTEQVPPAGDDFS